jgi:urea transporter/murein DD-endopeptidase MepM/ murein hydrolase activator NlpD
MYLQKVARILYQKWQPWYEAITNSYAQLFFSNNSIFALLLLLATFINPFSGFSGLMSLCIALLTAKWLQLPEAPIRNGIYSFNSLLTGLVLGMYFEYTISFWMLLILGSVFTLLVSVWLARIFYTAQLPILALPFISGIWILLLSIRRFDTPELTERGIYAFNELYAIGGMPFVRMYEWMQSQPLPAFWDMYLKSLGAIFFQYNILSGMCIALGLLIYSRIAFTLSLLGFATGYFFYTRIGSGVSELQYSYIGFNFILSAISLGGFFTIPSHRSYLLVLLITPVMALVVSAFTEITLSLQLPLYALPFNLMLLIMIQVLRLKQGKQGIHLTLQQEYQPERNLYRHVHNQYRFDSQTPVHIHPPIYGTWFVSQDHQGDITHLGDWRHALDFVVKDHTGKTYKAPGTLAEHYYAYQLPIVAPADGTVADVLDDIPDNEIGNVNLQHNWGNSIVIWHGQQLYSQISHLKAGSIKVKPGDIVKKGDIIAACGNSGRSPEPHIHFQLQATPYIGSKTMPYPLAYYLEKSEQNWKFHAFDVPKTGMEITAVQTHAALRDAFTLIPGKIWIWEYKHPKRKTQIFRWEVLTDALGYPYIWCAKTHSAVWFSNDGIRFRCTHFTGDRNSLLAHFYKAHFQVLLAAYNGVEIQDQLPVHHVWKRGHRYLQDFIAPFVIFLSARHMVTLEKSDAGTHPADLKLHATVQLKTGKRVLKTLEYTSLVQDSKLHTFSIHHLDAKAVCIES